MDDYYQRSLKIFITLLFLFSVVPVISGDDPIPNIEYAVTSDSIDVLIIFSAKLSEKKINLIWKVNNPSKFSYYEIEKKGSKNNKFESLKKNIKSSEFIESDENLNFLFSYTDKPEIDGVYFYRLKAFDGSGKMLWTSEEIKIGITGIRDFVLEQNQPNPFNPTTIISYELTSESNVKLKVFDLIGKEIATLVDTYQSPGRYKVEFNASNYQNITSGIYFYKLETNKYSDVKKMIISK
jgi:hypothetical protein